MMSSPLSLSVLLLLYYSMSASVASVGLFFLSCWLTCSRACLVKSCRACLLQKKGSIDREWRVGFLYSSVVLSFSRVMPPLRRNVMVRPSADKITREYGGIG